MTTEASGEAARDWFLNEYPTGGVMLTATGGGSVFLAALDISEDLEFISRSDNSLI